mgnify:CR=1 FL=1
MGYKELLVRMGEVNDLLCSESMLSWDERTMMPPGGAPTRAKQLATLKVFARNHLVSDETRRLLDAADAETASLADDSVERTICAQVREAIDYHTRVPAELVQRRAELGSLGQHVWKDARAKVDVAAFQPTLEWDIQRVQGAGVLGGGLFNTRLSGTGWIAITTHGQPMVLHTDQPTFADPQSVVMWSANLTTSLNKTVKAKSLVGMGSGEAFQVAFQGNGIVVIQPSEGGVVAPAQ